MVQPKSDTYLGRMGAMKLVLSLLTVAYLLHTAATLRISAFNIRTCGDTKLSNETIAGIIVNILSMYDLITVQEVRDSDLSAVKKLMNKLNRMSPHLYSYVVSLPLGRTSYKEQYLFIYRTGMMSVVDSYYYEDGCESCMNDTFSREPFIVKFSSPHTEVKEFVLVPLHASPNEAVAEIDALYDVYLDVISKWATDNILFLGDFNAGCSYVSPEDWASIRLRTNRAFQWLIPDSADTTVSHTVCAYDRIVASGSEMKSCLIPETAHVNNFQRAFNLQYKDALAVSDHFPVEVTLRSF
ncbi:deoxyribonuclease-1 isoform B [Alligator mississippiensis]|uniref:Deoxyribonuclease n=1 Tax=Alligator mississippiensis TaxID=8496 RepID=A0A151NH13_ALLMI|nr:deoxyribonuclease-1 isoform B [Alligator mississippiensis]